MRKEGRDGTSQEIEREQFQSREREQRLGCRDQASGADLEVRGQPGELHRGSRFGLTKTSGT